jgi:hypothetical protein
MSQELDNLAGLAAEVDQNTTAAAPLQLDANGQPIPEVQPPPSLEVQALDAVNTFAALVCGYAPKAAAIFTAESKAMGAAVLAPVMEKYGWSMLSMPCEFAAAIVLGPMLYQSMLCVREEMEAKRAAKSPALAETASSKGAEPEAPAGPVHPQMALYKK